MSSSEVRGATRNRAAGPVAATAHSSSRNWRSLRANGRPSPRRPPLTPKLKTLPGLLSVLKKEKKRGKKIVFTNGCFDILHVGHVRYLRAARALGNLLVVALNTDASVHRLKGPSRPVTPQKERAEVLAALGCVDYVVFFSDATPLKLIQALKPDCLVKGGDWKKGAIVGADFVESYGGKVRSLPFIKGFSTTGLIHKIKEL